MRDLETNHFWGELSLKFQDGNIVHAKKVESLDLQKSQSNSRAERREYGNTVPR